VSTHPADSARDSGAHLPSSIATNVLRFQLTPSRFASWEVDHSRFEIKRLLGKGSYGSVAEAVDHLTGQRVAIKKIPGVFEVRPDGARNAEGGGRGHGSPHRVDVGNSTIVPALFTRRCSRTPSASTARSASCG
jgi:hypothetical protein